MTEVQGQAPRDREHGTIMRPLVLNTPDAIRSELKRIGVDPTGIDRMLSKLLFQPVLLPGIRAAAANIVKQEMLSLGGDAAVARGTVACSVETTDVVLIGTRKQLSALCLKLQQQPFGLSALALELQELLAALYQTAPYWQTSRRQLSLLRPLVMGILNVTPDSFSDGGHFASTEAAVNRALELEAEGADLIDIGGESTRPGAPEVSADEEIRRVVPVVEQLAGRLSIPLSVDTWKAAVAASALAAGAEIVNDISGLGFDPAMAVTVAQHAAGLVLMHTRGKPQTMQHDTRYSSLMGEIAASLHRSATYAQASGISKAQIALDPGIGFGKGCQGNLEILRRLSELTGLGYPLLVGTSRKSFIGKTLGCTSPDDRLFGTAATVALAVANGASILRVHDVRAMKDVAAMAHAIGQPASDTEEA